MHKSLARAQLLVIIGILSISITSRAFPDTPTTQHQPIEVHVSESGQSDPVWLKVMDRVIWPFVVIVGLITFRTPLGGMFMTLATKGGDITIAGVVIHLPELVSKVRAQGEAISDQQGRLDEQSKKIRDLIKYSMSGYIFDMLTGIKRAKDSGGEYLYRNDNTMDRNLRYLIDHGYVQEVPHWPSDKENISSLVTITDQGYDVIAIRTS